MTRRALATLLALFPVLWGCASAGNSPTFDVAPGEYALAFEAAERTLRELRFTIDRVDALAGVITTTRKASSGLATPWDVEQSTPTQEIEDLVSEHGRRVRITFEPVQPPGKPPGTPADPLDVDLANATLTGRVEAVIDRRFVRGWRPSGAAILYSDFTIDTQATQDAVYDVPLTRDERLAARLAARIRERLEQARAQRTH